MEWFSSHPVHLGNFIYLKQSWSFLNGEILCSRVNITAYNRSLSPTGYSVSCTLSEFNFIADYIEATLSNVFHPSEFYSVKIESHNDRLKITKGDKTVFLSQPTYIRLLEIHPALFFLLKLQKKPREERVAKFKILSTLFTSTQLSSTYGESIIDKVSQPVSREVINSLVPLVGKYWDFFLSNVLAPLQLPPRCNLAVENIKHFDHELVTEFYNSDPATFISLVNYFYLIQWQPAP